MQTINKVRQTDEIRRCARDPLYFFNSYVKVAHPVKGALPFNTYKFQDECVQAFLDNRFVIVNKSRQLGLSTLAAAYASWLLLFGKNKQIVIMATKLAVAQNFVTKVKFCIKNLPKWLVLPKIVKNNERTLVFGAPSNSRIEAIPTAADAGRSEALSLLIVDEAAHVDDFEELWKGLYPTLSCVVGGTKVLLDDGFHDIEEFFADRKIGEYFELNGNIYGKNGFEPLSHGYVSPESETLKITTRKGLELEVTQNHPLWTFDIDAGGKMVKAKNLTVGDHLRVQHSMNVFGNDNTLDHKTVKMITPELAYILGGYIAEGWMTKPKDTNKAYSIWISNADSEFRDVYLNNTIVKPFHGTKNSQKLLCCSRELVEVFQAAGIDPAWKCDTKRIPKKIWRCSQEIQAAFLQGYFDGDGSATGIGVSASSTSRQLISDIHQLLLNFGIIPKILASNLEKAKKQIGVRFIANNSKPLQSVRQSWGIHVPRSQLSLYQEKIGFKIGRKRQTLLTNTTRCLSNDQKQHKIPLTTEMMSRLDKIISESGHAKSWFRTQGCRLPEKGHLALSNLKSYKEKIRYTSVETIRKFSSLLKNKKLVSDQTLTFLDEICGGNFYWDSIEKIENSHGKTYDFTVPNTHSFLQNSILGSNTGGRALIISTPKGVGNQFHKLWVDAQNKTNEFCAIELPWTVHPEHDETWFKEQASNMSQKAVSQELLCVAGETRIITKGGFKLAKDITVDDFVLTHKGRFKPVVKTHKRKLSAEESLYTISAPGNRRAQIIMTGNHPILSQLTTRSEGTFVQEYFQQNQSELKLEFNSASSIADHLDKNHKNRVINALFPRFKIGTNKQIIDLAQLHDQTIYLDNERIRYYRQWGDNKRFVDVDYDLGRFIGLWIADGYSNPCGKYGLGFAFHRDEYNTHLKFVDEFMQKYGLRTRPSMMKTSNACRIESHNQYFSALIKQFVGGYYANDKVLHIDRVIEAGIDFVRGLLVGYFQGDGTHKPDKKITAVSCNQQLLYQIRTLLSAIGHYPRVGYWKDVPAYLEIDNVKGATVDVVFSETKEKIELHSSRTRLTKDYVIGQVKIERINDNDLIDVYNFEVESDHTYVADGIVVHNCDFLASGDTYIDANDINWVGTCVKDPIRREGFDKNVWIWEDPMLDNEFKYIISADVGRGDADTSAFHILNTKTGEVVAEFKGRIRPDYFAKLLLEYGRKYNNALICPERNTYGNHVIIELINNKYNNIYFENQKNVYLGDYVSPEVIASAGFDTQRDSRKMIITKLEETIRNKQIRVNSVRLWNELKTFVTQNDKPQALKNCSDDLVMSLAIGVWLFDTSGVHGQFAQQLNAAMLAGFGVNVNSFSNMAGSGDEVLPKWTSMMPYADAYGNTPRRPMTNKHSPNDLSWLFKK